MSIIYYNNKGFTVFVNKQKCMYTYYYCPQLKVLAAFQEHQIMMKDSWPEY